LDDVGQFYKNHFTPRNSTLVVVGDVEPDRLAALLENTWGRWRGDARQQERPAAHSPASEDTVYVVDKPGAVQSVISVGRVWRGRQDETYYASKIGNRILGGDFLSRLNQNLRERNGYTYGARSLFRYRLSGSDWILRTSVRADVTGAAMREIMNELNAPLDERPLTEAEIATARDAELNVFPRSFETPDGIASELVELAIHALPDDDLARFSERLQATDQEEIAAAVRRLVRAEPRRILVVGDRQHVSKQLQEAGFQRVEYLDTDGDPVE
jgi:zinc protease